MRNIFFLIFFLLTANLFAQTYSLRGVVLDEKGGAISYATVALLNPKDSTLSFYSVTNANGEFELKKITEGSYVLQSAFIGYKSFYRNIQFPYDQDGKLFTILMDPKPINLPSAEVDAERIPLLIKGDTIEYDANAFKTKPDDVAEDLLKKLPGVSVDRNGNIKAQGEDVKKVTVDGKEFFGNDPKVATKNLPADAINKVQVFDTKSDQAELTGINDGQRDKTINLQLKDDKKTAWFGEVQGGAGSDDHYQGSAKAYRFTPEKQIAILGMLNNINKFGFSFSDYMNFNGGFGNGNAFRISSDDNSFPIDFGEVQKGLITSGSVGANYSKEIRKDNRYNFSYLANGMDKDLNQHEATANFTDSNPFASDQNSYQNNKNRAHRINFGWKDRIDTMHTFNLSGQGSLNFNDQSNTSSLSNTSQGLVLSDQNGGNTISGNSLNTNIHSSYLTKMNSNWKLLSLEVNGSWQHSLSQNDINTITHTYTPQQELALNQFQNVNNDVINYSGEAAITRKTGEKTYLEGDVAVGGENETYSRDQGLQPESDGLIDSLTGKISKDYKWLQPGIKYKWINDKTQFTLSLAVQFTGLQNDFGYQNAVDLNQLYLLPSLSWEKEYKTSHRLRLMYMSNVVAPKASELYPITDIFDPLNLSTGNRDLKPEMHNDFRLHWSVFDQFSFTSVFAALRFSYVKDKMNWSKTINENLVQSSRLINVPDDYEAGLSFEYTTPIRKLGVNITLSVDESWNKSFTFINNESNENTGINHQFGITFDNRKKTKWETSAGITVKQENSVISLPENFRQTFVKGNVFADIGFNPNESWQFSVKADLTQYYGKTFDRKTYVPLLQAEASFLFLKNKRGMLTLSGFDLLNRNTGIERMSEYNYVRETHSDIIQRYGMLTFRYKLNKFGSGNKVDVKVNGR